MIRKLLLMLLSVVLVFGCAGQGTFSGSTPYVGSYSGTWTCPANGHTGTMTLSISPHATIVGTYVDTTANQSGQISGTLAQSGSFRATVTMTTGSTSPMTGQFSVTSPGSAGAILAGNASVGTQAIAFTLPADTAAGTSPYAGSFTGTFTSASNGDFGTMTLTISNASDMQGSIVDAVAGTTGTISGSVTSTGGFTASVVSSAGTQTFTGQLTINTGVLAGNGTLTTSKTTEAVTFNLTTASTSTSAYAGSYTGAWNSATDNHSGQISWTVSPQGTILGTYVDTTAGTAGAIAGSVNLSGAFTTKISINSSTSYTLTGQITLNGTGSTSAMAGNATLNNGAAQTVTFSLPATPTVSPYSGTFSGSWDGGSATSMTWTVGPNGTIVGEFIDPQGRLDNLYGSTDNNGDFTVKATSGGTAGTVYYTLSGEMTYQVVVATNTTPQEGNEVGEGTLTPTGGSAMPFDFNIFGTINNVTTTVEHRTAGAPAARRR